MLKDWRKQWTGDNAVSAEWWARFLSSLWRLETLHGTLLLAWAYDRRISINSQSGSGHILSSEYIVVSYISSITIAFWCVFLVTMAAAMSQCYDVLLTAR